MAQPKLNQKSLNGIRIPLPPENKRAGMVKILDELNGQVELLEESYRRKLVALGGLKQSLLQKAFAGELT
jgi:type I restriction enzyme S subunit